MSNVFFAKRAGSTRGKTDIGHWTLDMGLL